MKRKPKSLSKEEIRRRINQSRNKLQQIPLDSNNKPILNPRVVDEGVGFDVNVRDETVFDLELRGKPKYGK